MANVIKHFNKTTIKKEINNIIKCCTIKKYYYLCQK